MRFANDDIFVGGVDRAMLVAHNYAADANRAGFGLGASLKGVTKRIAADVRQRGKEALQAALTPEGTQLPAAPAPVQSVQRPMSAYILPVGLGVAAVALLYFLTQKKGR